VHIYLHVPFCPSRCIYCDFFVVLEKHGGQAAYVDSVCREIARRFEALTPGERRTDGIRTLYAGGGTPSLLRADDYRRIFAALNRWLPFHPDAEITLEANPGGQRAGMADAPAAYRDLGFNRISVGVQSLNDAELKKLSRLHSAGEAEDFIRQLQRTGWENISIDLMYGLPLQTLDSWRETLRRAITLDVPHISMYGLKVEEGTPLERLASLPGGGYAVPEDETGVTMYFEALERLKAAGFERYEFSNLARPGYASRHNLNYWDQGEWLALGPSAHGYRDGVRTENVSDLAAYLEDPCAETRHAVPLAEQLENAIIFGLRKAEGIHIPTLERTFQVDFRQRYGRILTRYEDDFLEREGDYLRLKESGIPLSHTVLAEFLGG
jgi:oxygen-independent coproporphyrinogen-3 oxidase